MRILISCNTNARKQPTAKPDKSATADKKLDTLLRDCQDVLQDWQDSEITAIEAKATLVQLLAGHNKS